MASSAAMLKVVPTRGRPKGSKNKATLAKIQEFELPVDKNPNETDAQIDARLRKTFGVLEKMTQGVITRKVRGLIVSGAKGCGKSYILERDLSIGQTQKGIQFINCSGTMSAIGLYCKLYEAAEPECVLCIDDNDAIYYDLEALNVLKRALNTGKRIISWNKQNAYLEKMGIPEQFEFAGSVVFCTNVDMSAEIAKGSKISVHLDAMIDRCMYVDLGIHSRREIMIRMIQVMNETDFFSENRMTIQQGQMVQGWLKENFARVRSLSIRTAVHLGNLIRTDPENWRDNAEIVLCKRENANITPISSKGA